MKYFQNDSRNRCWCTYVSYCRTTLTSLPAPWDQIWISMIYLFLSDKPKNSRGDKRTVKNDKTADDNYNLGNSSSPLLLFSWNRPTVPNHLQNVTSHRQCRWNDGPSLLCRPSRVACVFQWFVGFELDKDRTNSNGSSRLSDRRVHFPGKYPIVSNQLGSKVRTHKLEIEWNETVPEINLLTPIHILVSLYFWIFVCLKFEWQVGLWVCCQLQTPTGCIR